MSKGSSALNHRSSIKWALSSNIPLLLMTLSGIACFICFNYLPMGGLVLAFKNFIPRRGIFGSEWIGFKNFEFMFRNPTFWLTVKNTLLYNGVFLVTNVVFPMSLGAGHQRGAQQKAGARVSNGHDYAPLHFLCCGFRHFVCHHQRG